MSMHVAYYLGILILLLGMFLFVHKKRRGKGTILYLLGTFFVTILIWYFPILIENEDYSIFEAFLGAILEGVGALMGDGYDKMIGESGVFYTVYSISIMLVDVMIVPLVFGTVLSLFNEPYQLVLNLLWKDKKPYVFIGINDRTLNIAKSIKDGKNCRLIFVTDDEIDESVKDDLADMNTLIFEKTYDYVFSKIIKDSRIYDKDNPIEIFVFNEREDENLKELSKLFATVKGGKNRNFRIFVEANELSWNNQNNIQKQFDADEKVTVTFVRSTDTFAFNNLYDNIITRRYVKSGDKKVVKALFVGIDDYSLSMIKCVMWLCQLPGYKLEICTIDENRYIEKLKFLYQGINKEMDEWGYGSFRLNMYENTDYNSMAFMDIIKGFSDFTYVFINCKDSIKNGNVSESLFTIRTRMGMNDNFDVQVKSLEKSVFDSNENYPWNHVHEVGSVQEIYSYQSITNSIIQKAAQAIFDEERVRENKNGTFEEEYGKDEYKRNSIFARSLGIRYKLELIHREYNDEYDLLSTKEWMEAEHMRWNVYTWLLGYIYYEKTDKFVGKTHSALVPFGSLSEEIQGYDAIFVNYDIVKILLP